MSLYWLVTAVAEAAEGGNFLPHETTALDRLVSFAGIWVLVGAAWLLSENRRAVNWRPVLWGVALQLAFGAVVLSPAVSGFFFTVVNGGVEKLLGFANHGATFLFQSVEPHLVSNPAGEPQFYVGTGTGVSPPVKTFAFWVLPTIIFFSSLMSVLYYLGIMQVVVKVIARAMVHTLGTSGAESLSAAGNIFVGQTEAPLLIRPFVKDMTRSELMAVMTGGFATVAGGVMGAYVSFLKDIPNIAGHLVVASILSAPAALALAKVMVPETGVPKTTGTVTIPEDPDPPSNVMQAAARGATDGMALAINVAAMIVAIVALTYLVDWSLGAIPVSFCDGGATLGYACAEGARQPLTLAQILSWAFAPVALLMGVPWAEAGVVGRLLGEKIVLTEFIAYINLGGLINGETAQLSERGAIIASYALCGFANFASIGIQIGGIGALAPNKMSEIASLGFKGMVAGTIAACMTGAVVGIYM